MKDSEVRIKEKTELGEVMESLDRDLLEKETKMSTIDFNTRLSTEQIENCLIFDEFTRMGILPSEWGLTRQLKRLSVSKDGEGRKEKVQIVAGDREQKSSMGFGQKLGNLFKRQE